MGWGWSQGMLCCGCLGGTAGAVVCTVGGGGSGVHHTGGMSRAGMD